MLEENKNDQPINFDNSDQKQEASDNFNQDFSLGDSSQEGGSYVNLDVIDQDIENYDPNENKIVLGDDGMKQDVSKIAISHSYWKLFVLSSFGMVIFAILSIGLYIYNSYLNDLKSSIVESKYDKYVEKYVSIKDQISVYLFRSEKEVISDLNLSEKGEDVLTSFLRNPSFSYVEKRDILQNSLDSLLNSTISLQNDVEELKTHVTKYGFFTEELKTLLEDQEGSSNIKRSLLSLENIKFSSAVQVFYYLDTFIEGLSNSLDVEKELVSLGMEKVKNRGEKDIMLYLNNCYLNPFEIDSDCQEIGDFDMYYKMTNQTGFDTSFFKRLMYYIDLKIEQTEIPSFSIIFNGFNSNSNNISFSINVDTFRQDEISLINKGILNPHIFVVNSLINFLKQSKFILGKDISSKNIRVQPKVINIGSNQFYINHSAMNFSLPIQKDVEREIFDFVEIIK
ncbi:hypothetical protein K9M48_02625 [Candidatus Gracilibacteria bacterium]|nr:hypothetical protein [Candidatus Gracilibacteria bacterium]